jgi:hypothetical protein
MRNFKPGIDDTLRYEESKSSDVVTFGTLLKKAPYDPMNLKVFKKCSKCPSKIASQVRIGENMKLNNICVKCKFQWLER